MAYCTRRLEGSTQPAASHVTSLAPLEEANRTVLLAQKQVTMCYRVVEYDLAYEYARKGHHIRQPSMNFSVNSPTQNEARHKKT